jgi:hypothetical protein
VETKPKVKVTTPRQRAAAAKRVKEEVESDEAEKTPTKKVRCPSMLVLQDLTDQCFLPVFNLPIILHVTFPSTVRLSPALTLSIRIDRPENRMAPLQSPLQVQQRRERVVPALAKAKQ